MHEDARNTIVDRYVNGRMSPAEEEEFLRMAGNDPRLRHLVRAERIVRGNALRWRESIARAAGDPPSALMTRLAATASGAGSPAAATSSPRSTPPGSRVARALMAALGIGGIAVGTFIVAPLLESPKPASRIEQRAPRSDRGAADGAHAPDRTGPEPSPALRSQDEPAALPVPTTQPRNMESAARPERREHIDAARSLPDTPPRRRPEPATPDQPVRSSEEAFPVIVRDSLQLHLSIDTSRR